MGLRSFIKNHGKRWSGVITAGLGVLAGVLPFASLGLGVIGLSITLLVALSGTSVSFVLLPDFGDDAGPFAKDGVCDDPRFEGEGMSVRPTEAHRYHDATDCEAQFRCRKITLIK